MTFPLIYLIGADWTSTYWMVGKVMYVCILCMHLIYAYMLSAHTHTHIVD